MIEARPRLVVEPDDGTLFLTVQGKPMLENPVSALVTAYFKAAGIERRGSCHLFRHSCATGMLEGGADIRFIQQMLGHASLDSTAIYTQVDIRKLKEIHTATHPTAKMGSGGQRRPG
jgi:integrase/recombinase XerD